jgi:hypothetical protein
VLEPMSHGVLGRPVKPGDDHCVCFTGIATYSIVMRGRRSRGLSSSAGNDAT